MSTYTDIQTLTIAKIQSDPFYSYFRELDETVLNQAFENAYLEINQGAKGILNWVDSYLGQKPAVYFMANLTCHYMLAYTLKPYLVKKDGVWVIEDNGSLPPLFRTLNGQSMDGVSVGYESERLGIGLNTPIEQWLSTTSFGFRCIQPLKDYVMRKGRIFLI